MNNITTAGMRGAMGNHIGDHLTLNNGSAGARIEKTGAKEWRVEVWGVVSRSRDERTCSSFSEAVAFAATVLAVGLESVREHATKRSAA